MILFVFVLMCLTAYRATRLLIKDTLPPVLWLRDNFVGGWRPPTEAERRRMADLDHHPEFVVTSHKGQQVIWVTRRPWVPDWLSELLSCPWCASAYISGLLTLVVDLTYGIPVPWLVGPAVWAVSALLASRDWA